MSPRVEAAKARLQQAQRALVGAAREAYPPGTVVKAALGAAVVTLRVDRVRDCWWSEPGMILGTNVNTGKSRNFHDGQVVEIISKPEPSHDNQ